MTLDPMAWPTSLVTQKLKTAKLVTHVVDGGPADKLGIRAGWHILGVDGDIADEDRIINAFAHPPGEIVFYDPTDQQLYGLHNGEVPLGFNVGPILTPEYGMDFRVRRVAARDFLVPWAAGEVDGYAPFQKDFMVALRPLMQNVLPALASKSKQRAAMLKTQDATSKLGLAMCYLASGQFDDAALFAEAYFADLNAQGGRDMSICLAAANYIYARAALHNGDRETARGDIAAAAHHYPRAIPVQELYLDLMGEPLAMPPAVNGDPVFPDYDLNRYDPYEFWPDAGTCALDAAVAGLGDGEYGLVCLMGDYRSNGPFIDDLSRLLSLQRTGGAHAPKFTHIISEFKGDPKTPHALHWASNETVLQKLGLQISVALDHNGTLAIARNITGAPTWYVVDRNKMIHGQGMLNDDAVVQAIYSRT